MKRAAVVLFALILTACASSSTPREPGGEGWKAYRLWPTISETRGKVGSRFKAQIAWKNTRGRPSFIEEPEYFVARTLPQGLSLNRETGLISGIPAESGRFSIRFGVRDKNKGTHSQARWYQTSITLEIKKYNDLR